MVRRARPFGLLALLLLAPAGLASCIDHPMPGVGREARIPRASVSCVREALLDNPAWDRKEYWEELPEAPRRYRTTLLLRGFDQRVDVVAELSVREDTASLTLRGYVEHASEDWPTKLEARRAHLARVYGALREACPNLPAWESIKETVVGPHDPADVRRFFVVLFGVPLGITALVLLLLGLRSQRAARRRRTGT